MKVDLDSKVSISSNVLVQEVDNETIILDMNTQEYFTLNEIGKVILTFLEEGKSLKDIHLEFIDIFEVKHKQIENDILIFINLLVEKKLLEVYFND